MRNRMLFPLLALGLLSVPTAGLAQNQPPAEFVISESGWEGGAFPVADTNEFSHCAVERKFEGEQSMALLMNDAGRVALGVGRTDWTLTPESSYEAQVSIDGGPPLAVTANPVSERLLIFPIGADPQVISSLQRGNEVSVTSEPVSASFPLVGTFKAIEALKACVNKAIELAQLPADQQSADRPAPRRMTAEAVAQLMDSAGITGIALASPDEIEGAQVPIEQAWRLGPLRGALHQEPRGQEIQIDLFADGFSGTFESLCPGTFSSEFEPTDVLREIYAVKQGVLTCDTDEGSTHTEMVIVLDDSFYTAFVHEGPAAEAENVSQVTDRLAETFRAMISGTLSEGAPAEQPAPAAE